MTPNPTPSIHHLVLQQAIDPIPLAELLAKAFDAGCCYERKTATVIVARQAPDRFCLPEAVARDLMRLAAEAGYGDASYADRASAEWTWNADQSGWNVANDDCLIRPGKNGLVVIEAACEYAGAVLTMPGTRRVDFPVGTFR